VKQEATGKGQGQRGKARTAVSANYARAREAGEGKAVAKVRRKPGPEEAAAIVESARRVSGKRPPLGLIVEGEGAKLNFRPEHDDLEGYTARLCDAFGSVSHDFIATQLMALEWTSRRRGAKPDVANGVMELNSAIQIVEAVRPEDELEAALAVQMAGNHSLTMELLGRAKATESIGHIQAYGNLAVKLQRTFTAQIEALARHRGKGQQTVRVEHVTVEAGAQAIVGDVHHHPGGRGSASALEDQSHAQSANPADAPLAALSSPDPERDGMPLAVDAERALPDARRNEPGRAKG
jgi:hypothetical protein